jgi:hypothetical protein
MKLSAPKVVSWWLALLLVILGIILEMGLVPIIAGFAVYSFWLVVLGYVILFLGTIFKGF